VSDLHAAEWPPLGEGELDDLVALAARCLEADGGLPLAADPSFLRRRWLAGVTVSARDGGGRLVGAGAVRDGSVFVGLVDPAARGRGIGAALLDWGLDRSPPVTVETEGLTSPAEKLFASRGLRRVFAEDVMRIDLEQAASDDGVDPDIQRRRPAGIMLETWSDATAPRFYAVYDASFRERPGFPGWSAAEWIEGVVEEGFRPDWSLLASVPDIGDAGFVTVAAGWIDQVGVLPAARGRGIGAALIGEALTRMRADGETDAWLAVNVDNPAAALFRRLGFADQGRRARYRR
jgi:mycothiol synthase